jgi:hypothetical protein
LFMKRKAIPPVAFDASRRGTLRGLRTNLEDLHVEDLHAWVQAVRYREAVAAGVHPEGRRAVTAARDRLAG